MPPDSPNDQPKEGAQAVPPAAGDGDGLQELGPAAPTTAANDARALVDDAPKIPAAAAAQPQDRFGRTFDPELHEINAKTGQPRLRAGRTLICKKSALGAVARPPAAGDAPHDGQDPGFEDDEDDDGEDDEDDGEPGAQPAPQPATLTPDERIRLAEGDAEEVVELEGTVFETLGGDAAKLTDEERQSLRDSAKRWFVQDDVQLPIRARGMHFLRLGRFTIRRINNDQVRARIRNGFRAVLSWISGKKGA